MRGNTRRCQAENPLIALSSFLEPALLAPPNLLLIGNLNQPKFQGHEAEKETSLYCVMEQNASDCHINFVLPLVRGRRRAKAVLCSLVTIGLKALYFEFFQSSSRETLDAFVELLS
jgi:hypothetical protein